jgi:hypothetical protein
MSPSPETPTPGSAPLRRERTLSLLTVAPLVAALGLAGLEVARALTSQLGQVGAPQWHQFFAAGLLLAGNRLAWMGIGVVAALALWWRGRAGQASLLGVGWAVAVSLYWGIDAHMRGLTDRPLSEYIEHLRDPGAVQWAGDLGPDILLAAFGPLLVGIAAGLAATLWACRALSGGPVTRGVRASSAACWVLLLAFWIGAERIWENADLHAGLLDGRISSKCAADMDRCERARRYVQKLATELYAAHEPPPRYAPALPTPIGGEWSRPGEDVLLFIVESFRRDALQPEIMPNLWRLSQRGARFENHFASSNASHGGVFSILYGRPPIRYQPTLDAGIPPNLSAVLRAAGYGTHFITGGRLEWAGMERYLAVPNFDTTNLSEHGRLWERDVQSIETTRRLLRESETPQLVVTALMSTHFPYVYPEERTLFEPVIEARSGLDPELPQLAEELRNRYRNAAHYVDELIATVLADVDLDRTLVIVTGDHGESIFDDGTLGHSSRYSPAQIEVPLVIAGAGVQPGRVIDHATCNVDLVATVFSQLGLRTRDQPGLDLLGDTVGRSYLPIGSVPSKGITEQIVLRGPGHGYYFDLYLDQPKVYYRGRIDESGAASISEYSTADTQRALRWLDDYLANQMHAPAASIDPVDAAPRATPATVSARGL